MPDPESPKEPPPSPSDAGGAQPSPSAPEEEGIAKEDPATERPPGGVARSAAAFAAALLGGALAVALALYLRGFDERGAEALVRLERLERMVGGLERRTEELSALEARVETLARDTAAGAEQSSAYIAELRAQVGDLARRLEELAATVPDPFDPGPLAARLDALESGQERLARSIQALAARAEPDDARLIQRLRALERALADLAAAVARLRGRVSKVEQRAPSGDPAPAVAASQAVRAELAALAATVAELETELSRMRAQAQKPAPADPRIAELEARLAALARRLADQSEAADRLQEQLGARMDAIEARLLELGAERAALSAKALLALELDRRLGEGGPYPELVPLLRRAVPNDGSPDLVSALAAGASEGLPTAMELLEGWRQVAALVAVRGGPDAARAAAQPRELFGLVTIRRKGGEPTTPPLALRVEEELRRGRLEAALALVRELPAPPPEPLAAWLRRAELRLAAIRLLARLREQLLEAVRDIPGPDAS